MIRPIALLTVVALAATGCSTARTAYQPTRTGEGELTLSYRSRYEIKSGGTRIATGTRYEGLADFMKCDPNALRHAREAESWGTRAAVFNGVTWGLAAGGLLTGFVGLGQYDDRPGANNAAMIGTLAAAIVIEVGALAFGASTLASRSNANGHAIDAVNYYNDAVGGACPTR